MIVFSQLNDHTFVKEMTFMLRLHKLWQSNIANPSFGFLAEQGIFSYCEKSTHGIDCDPPSQSD
jgi:hypothetical protein